MKKTVMLGAAAVALGAVSVTVFLPAKSACAANDVVSFKDDVTPIFKGRCVECHAPGGQGFEASGLDLTTYAGLMKGTKFGPMVVPGNPDTSNLMWLLDWRASPELRMPHGKKQIPICDRNTIRNWIRQGAKDN